MQKGNFIFWHTTLRRQKVITAYYVVDRVLRTQDVKKNHILEDKYHNPHLEHEQPDENDVIVFGDPIASRKLARPLAFDRKLARKLGLGIKFRKDRPDTQTIGSACREWRRLDERQVELLLNEIRRWEKEYLWKGSLLSTGEIDQIQERDLENYLTKEIHVLGKGLTVVKRQMATPQGRLDILLKDRKGSLIVVELKLDLIGRDAIWQLKRYMRFVRENMDKRVRGIIVCKGVHRAFEEDISKLDDVTIFVYGWKMGVQEW